jgi:tetratricopeptide (TPR) repeat protein
MVCPSCGGQLMISEKQEKIICSYCGIQFVVSKNSSGSQVSTENFLKLAKDAHNIGKLDEAFNYYNRALELEPENYLAWYGKAEIVEDRFTQRSDEGRIAFIKLEPLIGGGGLSNGMNKFRETKAYFKKAIECVNETKNQTVTENVNFEIASICKALIEYNLREFWTWTYVRRQKMPNLIKVNNMQLLLTQKYKEFIQYSEILIREFSEALDGIEDKQRILELGFLQLTRMCLLEAQKPLPVHFQYKGFMNVAFVPDITLTLSTTFPPNMKEFFELITTKFMAIPLSDKPVYFTFLKDFEEYQMYASDKENKLVARE